MESQERCEKTNLKKGFEAQKGLESFFVASFAAMKTLPGSFQTANWMFICFRRTEPAKHGNGRSGPSTREWKDFPSCKYPLCGRNLCRTGRLHKRAWRGQSGHALRHGGQRAVLADDDWRRGHHRGAPWTRRSEGRKPSTPLLRRSRLLLFLRSFARLPGVIYIHAIQTTSCHRFILQQEMAFMHIISWNFSFIYLDSQMLKLLLKLLHPYQAHVAAHSFRHKKQQQDDRAGPRHYLHIAIQIIHPSLSTCVHFSASTLRRKWAKLPCLSIFWTNV